MKSVSNALFILAVLLTGALTCSAQQPTPADTAATTMTIKQIVQAGGPLMYVLAAMSVAAVAFIIYLSVILRREAIIPREFLHDVHQLLAADRVDEARQLCRRNRSPLAVIADTSLKYLQHIETPDPVLLKEVIEGEGGRQATMLQTQTQYLLDIGVIAPMVGLLGTVFGMVHAFGVVALDLAKAKPMVLAGGVAEALVNTAGGLIVGIPAMMFYAYFRGRSSKLVSELEAASLDLMTSLVGKRRR